MADVRPGTEHSLRESEELFQDLADSLPPTIFIAEHRGLGLRACLKKAFTMDRLVPLPGDVRG